MAAAMSGRGKMSPLRARRHESAIVRRERNGAREGYARLWTNLVTTKHPSLRYCAT